MYHDVLEKSEVFFDLQPEDFEGHLKTLLKNGLTPVSPDQLVHHLRTGSPLPEKPVLLSFDDGYAGHYTHVYPLLKKYQVPAVFFVFPGKVDGKIVGRSTLSWEQLKTMAADPLITIASHSVTHPTDLRTLDDQALAYEVTESKRRLEEELGIPIRYFSYPTGYYDERVSQAAEHRAVCRSIGISTGDRAIWSVQLRRCVTSSVGWRIHQRYRHPHNAYPAIVLLQG
jgi:peptidoglycan/xylan/chitin deacetylase (PgdA/CDA1 family)